MKKILITQRFEKIGKFKEKRDNIDIRFVNFFNKIGYLPLLIPNNYQVLRNMLEKTKFDGIVLSPGGNPKLKDIRKQIEEKLINYSIKKKIPLLGVCRGAQSINIFFKGNIKKINNHVRKKKYVYFKENEIKHEVRCFHDYAIYEKTLSNKFQIVGYTLDGSIEIFKMKTNKIMGIMWHPERIKSISATDKKIIKNFLDD